MKGVEVYKAKIVSDDNRRTITEIINGQLAIKNLKILRIKKGEQLLGNHWHHGGEVMYVLKGSAKYRMENIDTGEIADFNLTEGDIILRTGRIVHAGIFQEDSIIIDGGESTYVSSDFNDIPKKIM